MKYIALHWIKKLILLGSVSWISSSCSLPDHTTSNGVLLKEFGSFDSSKTKWIGETKGNLAHGNGTLQMIDSRGTTINNKSRAENGYLMDIMEKSDSNGFRMVLDKPSQGQFKLYDNKEGSLLGVGKYFSNVAKVGYMDANGLDQLKRPEYRININQKAIEKFEKRTGIYAYSGEYNQNTKSFDHPSIAQQRKSSSSSENGAGALGLLGMVAGGVMSAGGNEYGSIVSGTSETIVANSSESDVQAIGGILGAGSRQVEKSNREFNRQQQQQWGNKKNQTSKIKTTPAPTTSISSANKARKENQIDSRFSGQSRGLRWMAQKHARYKDLVLAADTFYKSYQKSGDEQVYQKHVNTVDILERWNQKDNRVQGGFQRNMRF